jgi:CheY-like chemotaxis protein
MSVETETAFQGDAMPQMTEPGTKKILVIDDDVRFVKLLHDSLSAEGYVVLCGYNGHMALEMAKEHSPTFIVMDVNMPFMDGIRAFQKLREDEVTKRIPIIFISDAVSQVVYPVIEGDARAAHLKKPLDLVDLSSLLRHFARTFAA